MSTQIKFNLTETHKREGLVLTIVWGGGLSCLKGQKERVQKLVQSIHHISPLTVNSWLVSPTNNHWTKGADWKKKSDTEKIISHVMDYIHDQSKNGLMLSWYLT